MAEPPMLPKHKGCLRVLGYLRALGGGGCRLVTLALQRSGAVAAYTAFIIAATGIQSVHGPVNGWCFPPVAALFLHPLPAVIDA